MVRRRVLIVLWGVAFGHAPFTGCDSSVSEKVDAAQLPDAAAVGAEDGGLDGGLDAAPSREDAAVEGGAALFDAAVDAARAIDAGPAFVCDIQAPTSCSDAGLGYGDVAPIFAARCVICHAGSWNGPWPLDDYQHVADWEDTIRANLLDCTMPPIDAGVPMTRDERAQILDWLRCGRPR